MLTFNTFRVKTYRLTSLRWKLPPPVVKKIFHSTKQKKSRGKSMQKVVQWSTHPRFLYLFGVWTTDDSNDLFTEHIKSFIALFSYVCRRGASFAAWSPLFPSVCALSKTNLKCIEWCWVVGGWVQQLGQQGVGLKKILSVSFIVHSSHMSLMKVCLSLNSKSLSRYWHDWCEHWTCYWNKSIVKRLHIKHSFKGKFTLVWTNWCMIHRQINKIFQEII